MKNIAIATAKILGALVGFLIASVMVFTASIETPILALLAGAVGLAFAWWLWALRPSVPHYIIAGISLLFVLGNVASYVRHRDGMVARDERIKTYEGKIKAEAEAAEKRRATAEKAAEEERIAKEKAAAEAAARAEQQKREEAEMQALRKSNADQYLAKLKEKDNTKWLEELKVLRPRLYATHIEQEKKEADRRAAEREEQMQRVRPLDYLTLDMGNWYKGGFDTVMIVTLTIKSTLRFPVKDLSVRCTLSGNSGTELSSVDKVLYEIVPPRSTKRFNEVNMGFVPSQATRARCELRSVQL